MLADLGSSVPLTWQSGGPGPATATITQPDGTILSPTVTTTGALHTASFTTGQAGRYLVSWLIAATAEVHRDVLNVWPADPRWLIGQDEALRALNRAQVPFNPGELADLPLYLSAVTPVIEDITNAPVLPKTLRLTAPGGLQYLMLPYMDAQVLAMSFSDGSVPPPYTCQAGVLRPAGGAAFPGAGGTVTVAYSAGNTTPAPNILMAAREEFRFLWQIGKQAQRPSVQGQGTDVAWTPSGFAVPKRVIELVGRDRKPGGFA